jgi:hypothetical protein
LPVRACNLRDEDRIVECGGTVRNRMQIRLPGGSALRLRL